MEKQPLQPAGLQQLLSHLYALPDPELLLKAAAIAADFKSWIAAHFVLSGNQLSFLASLDNRFIATAANTCSDFVTRRLPIVLVKKAADDDKPRGKIITMAKQITSSDYQLLEYFETKETLTFTISYPLIS